MYWKLRFNEHADMRTPSFVGTFTPCLGGTLSSWSVSKCWFTWRLLVGCSWPSVALQEGRSSRYCKTRPSLGWHGLFALWQSTTRSPTPGLFCEGHCCILSFPHCRAVQERHEVSNCRPGLIDPLYEIVRYDLTTNTNSTSWLTCIQTNHLLVLFFYSLVQPIKQNSCKSFVSGAQVDNPQSPCLKFCVSGFHLATVSFPRYAEGLLEAYDGCRGSLVFMHSGALCPPLHESDSSEGSWLPLGAGFQATYQKKEMILVMLWLQLLIATCFSLSHF